ncbi:3'-5' exonuclease family protein [Ehrlichia chaffeensis str. Heartland]|uniref:3'-5' exonuclease family protein n=2 Tax=Ehrlichia chaffeensis TaxID=945 RepID=Q2GFI6_EHRCR|nr:ribonuclease D [Ehrlichia chaffeensis]AAY79412.1 ribonuclease D [Ehrlichia chaffeensis]ABD44771.1 3'-5' exonuclease family protein [Ehrlichia chaffeensis str. Arkansas]AHX03324.1 3'-5' exonuclease family protein [Ehrlichia chaffeensis str. Heartland]AHX05243.1 3'-5' exonuclease family protein [Ehrlichia chaffeensis str. Jax]AHX06229.1 3'-5' exonuclease family protein [Ehrlichia chaffeensis str. Liberty]
MPVFVHDCDLPNGLKFENTVAVDTETMGLVCRRDKLCVVQLCDSNGETHLVKFLGSYQAPNLVSVLSDSSITKIFHFARFDIAVIRYYLGVWATPCYCTKIASKLVRTYTDHHGLKELCYELLNVKLNKMQQSSDWGKETLTSEQLNYAASDVIYLHALKNKLDAMLQRENKQELAASCFGFLPTRAQLDLLGWDGVDIFSHAS